MSMSACTQSVPGLPFHYSFKVIPVSNGNHMLRAQCPGVCVSVASWSSVKWLDRLSGLLTKNLPSAFPTMCCKPVQVPSKNKGISLWNLIPKSELSQSFCFFHHGMSIAQLLST